MFIIRQNSSVICVIEKLYVRDEIKAKCILIVELLLNVYYKCIKLETNEYTCL